MKKLIVVADWVLDSLTCQEFKSATNGFLQGSKDADISFVNVAPSTINTGFVLNQIVEIEERFGRPMETIIFQNTDPRLNDNSGEEKARAAEFIVIRLLSGMYVCGPNAGNNFSFIKIKIDKVFRYPNLIFNSQFRSRDFYSRICAHLLEEMEDEMELEEINTNMIPEFRGTYVAHIDNYGNMKTTIKHTDFIGKYEYGDMVSLKINGIVKQVKYVNNLFGASVGELVIYPGSSGPKDDPYLEVTCWSHFTEKKPTTGAFHFNFPKLGDEINLGK